MDRQTDVGYADALITLNLPGEGQEHELSWAMKLGIFPIGQILTDLLLTNLICYQIYDNQTTTVSENDVNRL